ncbi:MAG: hypothetical protein ACTSRS_13485 [Candidatus Helarchaeota archaeon]
MEESPVDRLIREKEDEAIEKDEDVLIFVSPDRKSTSKLIVQRDEKKLIIQTTLYHNTRMIDENIYLAANILSGKFKEEEIRDIIDDVSARLRLIEYPKMLEQIEYGFEIIDRDENSTKFRRVISYENENLTYERLRDEFETILMRSYELIYGFLLKMSLFIQTELNQFLLHPEKEMKLLEIRKLLFQAKFYTTMSGRFANDQQRIARSMRKEALELLAAFRKEFGDQSSDQLQEIREFFELEF